MKAKQIELDFGEFKCMAELFDSKIAELFAENLPYEVELTHWGEEVYGPIDIDLGEEDPVDDVPPGGIAYSRQGNYICVFFGQIPAWSVEHIGQIPDGQWELLEDAMVETVHIKKK